MRNIQILLSFLYLTNYLLDTVSGQNCSTGFERFGDSCYYFIRSQLGWYDADQYCTTLLPLKYKSHLASIESSAEQSWLADKIRNNADLRDRDVWVSLNRADKKLNWLWAGTYRNPSYLNWGSGEPSGSGKCARLDSDDNYKWNDALCYQRYSSACEYSLFDDCPPNFVRYQNSCYRLIPSSLTWFEAEQFCTYMLPNTYTVHLSSIESSSEQQFIVDEIRKDSENNGRDFWVAGNKIDTKKRWSWVNNNKPFTYTNWGSGEPSGSGDCMWLDQGESYKWNDKSCTDQPSSGGFVCEFELPSKMG